MRSGRAGPDLRPVALHAGPGRIPLGGPGLRAGLVCRARHHVAGPRRGGRRRRRDPAQCRARRDDPGRRLATRLGQAADRVPGCRRHAPVMGPHRLGADRRPRCPDAHPGRVRLGLRRAAGVVRTGPRHARGRAVRGVADPAHGPAPGAGSDGSRQQRGLRGLARRGGPGRRWHRRPSGPCRGWPVSSTPGQPRRAPPSTQRCGRTAMPGRAGSGTTTATCSAPGSSRSRRPARRWSREPGPRSGLRPRCLPRVAPRGARRRRPGRRAARDAGAHPRARRRGGRPPARPAGAGRMVGARMRRPHRRLGADGRSPRALDHRRGRARDRRLRPGALGGSARAQRGRSGGPDRDLRGAARGEPRPVGTAAGHRPPAGRPPPGTRPGELRDDVPARRRARPGPPGPGAPGARGGQGTRPPRPHLDQGDPIR